ncbi:hypothetical protein Tco_0295763 [Tanacetum coccineum]
MSRRVESSEDQESLGNHEDASKQGRSIADVDADIEVTFVDETQERQDDESMFDIGVLDVDEIPVEAKVDEKNEQSTKLDDSTAGEAVTTASVEDNAAPTTIEEITLAQTLIQIKAAKPKVVTMLLQHNYKTNDKGGSSIGAKVCSEFPQSTPSILKDKRKKESKEKKVEGCYKGIDKEIGALRRLVKTNIEVDVIENVTRIQVQPLVEVYLVLTTNQCEIKIASSYEICFVPHDAQYYMENPEKAFVDYPSSHSSEVGGTDKTKITRKPSKTGKHGHEERKSTKEARDAKPKAGKVKKSKLWSTLGQFSVNKSQP